MESSSALERTEVGLPNNAEIAARLEKATRSVLASSSLASYSYSQSRKEQLLQLPSLSDLLTHVCSPDCPRCPSCHAPLPFGTLSTFCLACDATIVEISPPSLTSSLAFRRFSEALGLETDFGVAEEDHCPDPKADFTNKSSAASSLAPVEASAQKGLPYVEAAIEQEDSHSEVKKAEAVVHIPLPHISTTGGISSSTTAETMGPIQEHSSIFDYSAKLEGISLEDFFSNQVKQKISTPPNSNTSSLDVSEAIMPAGTSGIKVQKDSLFGDPLSEAIIPDGFDMITTTREVPRFASDKASGFDEDDDPFDSWEGDFQSAPPAVSGASALQAPNSQSFTQPGDLEDFFGNFSSLKQKGGGESTGFQGSNAWSNDMDCFHSSTHSTVGRNTDVDLLFGSEWQQSMQSSTTLTANNSQSSSLFTKTDMLGPLSPAQKEMPGIKENSFDFAQEGNSKAAEDVPLTEIQALHSAGTKSKIVGSLLFQLHDLSFMLSDRLVIKAEGKGNHSKPDSLS